ncbi:MAG: asparagine synthase (glutamine-hydrolyzing) [Acidobacteriaceae bacterium]|nr:asparagine synthase (glutamine-hydrolyzing) [Acidobacteriaceae bacterium]
MCGIAGLIDCSQPVDARFAKQMVDVVKFRGPDDEGFAYGGDVVNTGLLPKTKSVSLPSLSVGDSFGKKGGLVLGHRRLSILDLSPAGWQPMCSLDSRFWIVFNGEIYNYQELRTELRTAGHEFRSNCDTEVLLAAYAHWAEECVHHLNGMWGFAILDIQRKLLFASRDRFGVKPFYYAIDGDRFGFSSEIKQLRKAGFGTGRADRFRVAQFLLYQTSNAERETLFQGIRQLLPGEAMQWRIDQGTKAIETFQYYNPSYNRAMRPNGSLGAHREEFKYLLQDAVRLRLRSDVPVGTCLSGGLDSSSIVITANRLLARNNGCCKQKSFTSCFEDARFDEWNFAASVALATGVEAHRVFPNMDKLWDEIDQITWHQEEPFASTSVYAQWNVMRLAHENGIKVLLDGQGSDEVMAGYHLYIPFFLFSLAKEGLWLRLCREIRALHRTGLWDAAINAIGDPLPLLMLKALRKVLGVRPMMTFRLSPIMKEEFALPPASPIPQRFQDQLHHSIFGSLQPLLRFEDRNSMAFSIEARTPFLDYRLVELFLRMCGAFKFRDGWTKPFIRDVMQGTMPEDVRLRADKKGFVTPEIVWYQKEFDRIRSLLLSADSPVHLWADGSKLTAWLDRQKFDRPTDFRLWRLLSVHLWMLRFGLQ